MLGNDNFLPLIKEYIISFCPPPPVSDAESPSLWDLSLYDVSLWGLSL